MEGNHILLHSFDLDLALDVSLKGREEEAVRTLLDLSDFDVLGLLNGLPMLSVLDEQPLGQVADAVGLWFGCARHKGLLSLVVVDELKRLPCVVNEAHLRVLLSDDAVVLVEDYGGRPE